MNSKKQMKLRAKRRKNARAKVIKKIAVVAAGVGLLVLITAIGWTLFGGHTLKRAGVQNAGSQETSAVEYRDPELPYTAGQAGIQQIYSTPENPTPGWQYSEDGWWYALSKDAYYVSGWADIDGKTYHFDEDGYISTGWTPIGGKGYYFDENGVYDAGKDSSMMIAMTFDDGPSMYTSQLLDILERTGAKATFFMCGNSIEEYGDGNIQRMAELGCDIGNHSYDHPDMRTLTYDEAVEQFSSTDDLIAQYNNGQCASVVRIPYGEYTDETLQAAGRPCFFWELDTLDWDTLNVDSNINMVLNNVEGGIIVLMHDIFQSTVESCETIIPELVSRGYELVSIRTLAAARGFDLQNCTNYYGFTDYYVEQNQLENYPELYQNTDTDTYYEETSDDTGSDEEETGGEDDSEAAGDATEEETETTAGDDTEAVSDETDETADSEADNADAQESTDTDTETDTADETETQTTTE